MAKLGDDEWQRLDRLIRRIKSDSDWWKPAFGTALSKITSERSITKRITRNLSFIRRSDAES